MKRTLLLIILLITGFANAQIVNIPNAAFKAKLIAASAENTTAKNDAGDFFKIDANNDGQIQYSEAIQVKYLDISDSNINAELVGLQAFVNLEYLNCSYNILYNLNVQNFPNLKELNCTQTYLNSLNVQGLVNLTSLDLSRNQDVLSINVQNLINLKKLNVIDTSLIELNVQGLTNLEYLGIGAFYITTIDLQGLTKLKHLYVVGPNLSTLDLQDAPLLETLQILYNSNLNSLDIDHLGNLKELRLREMGLTELNLTNKENLQYLDCSYNQLSDLPLTNLPNLKQLECNNNLLTTINANELYSIESINCTSNPLVSIFAKNGKNESIYYNQNWINTTLRYLCVDEEQYLPMLGYANFYNWEDCVVSTYCTFNPGGEFFTLEGNQKFVYEGNTCETSATVFPNFKCSITSSNEDVLESNGQFIANTSGSYNISLQQGNHVLTPILQNPSYFSVSPETLSISFPEVASPYNQDFCITANGVHNDLEISLLPISQARPGFDSDYRIVFQNKGTTIQSGSVNLSYDDNRIDFISSNQSLSNQASGNLSWNFTNIAPFETREIQIVFNLNSPLETPALNSGDILSYTATIVGQDDESPGDNVATINQIVVNSFDPNDKTCLEGTTLNPSMAGKYVHYMIRFENLGTADAQNVVVKDIIDTSKFDINSLIPIKGSHTFETRISDINKVEFIFENIDLPFDDANNDGYIAFKIKTKSNLVVGDTFSNLANIYFDYNAPIITNNYITTLQNSLGLEDNNSLQAIVAFPNPVKDVLNFTSEQSIIKVQIYDVSGRILSSNTTSDNKIDLRNLKSGNYFIKVFTEIGSQSMKIIKD